MNNVIYDKCYVPFEEWYKGNPDEDVNPNLEIRPEIGMGCTYYIGTDTYDYTVIGVINEKKCVLERVWCGNKVERVFISQRKDKRWREVRSSSGGWYELGIRSCYADPGF